ncbi:PAS domain S-box protein [uncultured Methylobacterium sp.]|uniref:PAS domain S-box protein n=1 Tax=uncultured Methylobacterium sp. TaxID=157278 RepID=UPI0035CC6007
MTRTPPLPAEVAEVRRLAALAAYGILDTPPEQGFDDIVDLAALICATPVALVSLVDGDRQWFKARAGFEPCQTPLDRSVCVHALAQPGLLVIPDLTLDPRTRANPQVTGAPHLRFYAGAPLEAPEGSRLGTLCVIDHAPRPAGLTGAQASALTKLAGQVMSLMELRRAVASRDAGLAERHAAVLRHEALIAAQAAISSARGDLDAILDALVAGAMTAVPQAEGGVIEIREGDELVYRTVRGNLVRHRGLRLPLHGSLSGHCLRTGEAVSSPDVLLDDRVKRDVVAALCMRSAIYVPVFRAGEAIGVLKLQSSRVAAFTQDDLAAARLFAGTVAAGLAEAGEAEAHRGARASESRYRTVFDSAIDYAIIVMDLDGRVTDWNAGATRILGWSPDEMRGRAGDIFFLPEDRSGAAPEREMRAALEHGRGADERWHLRKDGSRFWASGEMMALRDEAGTAVGFVKILRDRTEQRRSAAALAASEATLRVVLDTIPVGVLIAESPSSRIVGSNARVEAIFRHGVFPSRPGAGPVRWRGFHADGRPVEPAEWPLIRVARDGEARAELEVDYQRGDGTRAWIGLAGAPMRDADGRLVGGVVVVSDIDARKRAEEQRDLRNHELSHRMKNLLTMVQAIAGQTLRGATDIDAAKEVLAERLITLGKAHDQLLGGVAERATIEPVIRGGVGLQDDASGRVRYHGSPVEIGGRAALSLALMVHELATNAVKYGALSVPEGRVDIAWSVSEDPEPVLAITWREAGGPPVVPPSRKGFGSRLIERGLVGTVDGSIALTYPPEGVRCVVAAPLRNFRDAL